MISWDEVPDVLPEPGPHPLDAHEDRSRLRLKLCEDDRMHWRSMWDGNASKAGQKRFYRAVATAAYAAMVRVMRDGRRIVQPDLFAR